jgi:hypothetical protein
MLRADDALSTALSAHFDAIEAEDRALREWNRVEAETVKAGVIFDGLQNERSRGAALDLWRMNDPQARLVYARLTEAKRIRREETSRCGPSGDAR